MPRGSATARRTPALKPALLAAEAPQLILREDVGGKGRGVFAGQAFDPGAEVLEFLGDVRKVQTFNDLTHALQIGEDTFLGPSGGVDDYVNHSCEPNTGIRQVDGRVILFALRPIEAGDEITFDYSTTQSGGYWTMACQCGSGGCRGVIGDFADLPKPLRSFYVRNRAVLPFLVD
jgi:hypothetical protein